MDSPLDIIIPGYLYLGVAAGILWYLFSVCEDIAKGRDYKFGYNYKNPVIIAMSFVLMVPIVNLYIGAIVLYVLVCSVLKK